MPPRSSATASEADATAPRREVEPAAGSQRRHLVTGSRIRRPNLESTVPITSVGGEEFFQQGHEQHRRHAERPAAAAQHLRPAELRPLRHRHRRPQPARPSRPRHVPHPGAGQRPPPRRRGHPQQRRFAGHQHDPERPDRARRHRDGRQLGHLRLGRDRGRGQLRPAPRLRRPPAPRPGRRSRARAPAPTNMSRPCTARTSPTAAATSRVHAEYFHQDRVFGSDIPWLAQSMALAVIDVDAGRRYQRQRRHSGPHLLPRHPQRHHQPLRPDPDHADRRRRSRTRRAAAASARPAPSAGLALQLHLSCSPVRRPVRRRPEPASAPASPAASSAATARPAARASCCRSVRKCSATTSTCLRTSPFSDAFEPFVEAKWNRVDTLGSNAGPSFIQGTQASSTLASASVSTTRS